MRGLPFRNQRKTRLKMSRQRSSQLNCSAVARTHWRKVGQGSQDSLGGLGLSMGARQGQRGLPTMLGSLATALNNKGRLVIASACRVGIAKRTNKDHQL